MGKNDFKSYSWTQGEVKVKLDLSRFEKQFEDAQYWLDRQVMTDMLPYMPRETGTFINLTKQKSASLAGTGWVAAATGVTGRFLYEGKVMIDSKTRKGPRKIPTGPGEFVWRYRKGAVLIPSERDLTYSNPDATAHWFDTAKKNHGDTWIGVVKKIAGGG